MSRAEMTRSRLICNPKAQHNLVTNPFGFVKSHVDIIRSNPDFHQFANETGGPLGISPWSLLKSI